MQKKPIIIGVAVLVIIAGGVALNFKKQKEKKEATDRVVVLSQQAEAAKGEMLELYQKRYQVLVNWEKIAKEKIPFSIKDPITTELKTEQDIATFEAYQLSVSNQFTALLAKPEFNKKIKELDMLEHQINKKRAEYHSYGFEADDLIQKHSTGQLQIPVFPAEKILRGMKK